jgi:mRNA-degrading endonuclease toxin of MazEF toxin-antitoxin module
VYDALREEAALLGRPATVVARDAIEAWLRERKRAGVREAIATYVAGAGRPRPYCGAAGEGASGLRAPSVALSHQVTTLDRAKLRERVGTLPHGALGELDLD